MLLLQIVVLVCTLGLWTFGAGYLLLLKKGRGKTQKNALSGFFLSQSSNKSLS
ncbi:MAG: hypothetical protein K6F46_04245 [Desulfovibrio sp.]|nr:hypothetical protein [Desulfovibrio sp.]